MIVKRLGAHRVRILDGYLDREHQSGFIRSYGWLDTEPTMFLERAAFPGPQFMIPLSKAYMFVTPDVLPKLFKDERPLDPAMCASATVQAMEALHLDFSPFAAHQIVDVVQHGFDRLYAMPPWMEEEERGAALGEVRLFIEGALAHEAEIRA
ncbi:hypothetical protein AA0N74_07860 [Chromobacterium vaccinii]|uniref:hypothetical protein n=1 Tax=Chromobacterium vaccinii TaxID=1108595 RepID=UPI0031DA2001